MGWGQEKDTFVITQSPYLGIVGRDVSFRLILCEFDIQKCVSQITNSINVKINQRRREKLKLFLERDENKSDMSVTTFVCHT